MAELKIPNLNKNSDKYFFKKKLSLRRKSKAKLIKESFFMLIVSVLIIYLNYLIPNKVLIFKSLLENSRNIFINLTNSITSLYEIIIALFIISSLTLSAILIVGSFFRLFKIIRRKTKRIPFNQNY